MKLLTEQRPGNCRRGTSPCMAAVPFAERRGTGEKA
jgi:hypothetical protein